MADDAALAARLLADCRALRHRRLLDDAVLSELERALSSSPPPSRAALSNAQQLVRDLLERELADAVERTRVARNEQQRQAVGGADLAAIAAGGALGALNAWLRPAKPAAPPASATTLWASAYDAAAASLHVSRQRRQVEHMRVTLVSGDPAASTRVLLCINGFMTQRDDPAKNWQAWSRAGVEGDGASDAPAVFAVEWEAGDAAAWSEFCAHANDGLAGAPVSSVVAHFSGNPWHKAQAKAEQVGVLLAQLIARSPVLLQSRELTLLGHSLGGAVVFSAVQELARLQAPLVTDAVSFAGAFIPDSEGLASLARGLARGGKFLNVFSTRDNVLTKLFWAVHRPGHSDPVAAGCRAVAVAVPVAVAATDGEQAALVNVDVSDLVPPSVDNHFGHSYGRHMDAIAQRVLPHLRRPATA